MFHHNNTDVSTDIGNLSTTYYMIMLAVSILFCSVLLRCFWTSIAFLKKSEKPPQYNDIEHPPRYNEINDNINTS